MVLHPTGLCLSGQGGLPGLTFHTEAAWLKMKWTGLIYFTFRQIFTDIEAVIVIHRNIQSVQSICHKHNL